MKKQNHHHDVIIIGAGAAGLACASKLKEQGFEFLLLEAQSRVGGRAFSETIANQNAPIELGAEFIHGAPKSTLKLLQQLNVPFYDVADDHFYLENKKLILKPDYARKLEKIMKAVKAKKKDVSIADFLSSLKSKDSVGKAMFKSYVEGFQAADLSIIGTESLALAEEAEADDQLNGSESFRPTQSYQSIFEKLFVSLRTADNFRFDTVLKNIDWSPHNVILSCATGPLKEITTYRCKKLILTVPIGVLKSEQIQWNTKPKALENILNHLEMGHIQRVTFCFRTRFWEALTEKPIGFFHLTTEHFFPTWWTYQPMRAPYLIAWQGGPKAKEMSSWPKERLIETALKTLSVATGLSKKKLNSQLISWHHHDWSEDPYSLGAYSYVAVDGLAPAKKLATPIKDTIYFAGEGTIMGPARGTIHGALISGEQAALKVIKKIR